MTPLHDHQLNVADLVDQPGSSRRVDLRMAVPEDFAFPLVEVADPLTLDAVVESVVDGILVRGEVHADMSLACARCLAPLTRPVTADVVELFMDPLRTPGDELEELEAGYEIVDAHIDLDALLRDALAPNAPYRPLCHEECRGLCAQCGADLNAGDCGCREDEVDPRWAKLAELRSHLPDEEASRRGG